MKEVIMSDEYWEDLETGTEALMQEWLVKEGDHVEADQVIANIAIIKTMVELTAPADGLVDKILVKPEETFAKGVVLATIQEE